MLIRRITQAERDQFGRLAYEARQTGKSWFHVGQETVSRLVEPGKDPSSTAQYLCREYALRYRQPWPIPIAGPPFTGDAAIDAFNSRAARQDAIDELLSGDKAKAARIAKSQRAAALDPQPAPLIEHASAEAPPRILSPGQVAAARSLMGLSQTQFGELAGLSRATVSRIEEPKPGGPKPTAKAWRAINATIEARGVKVLDDDGNEGIGVRLAASSRKP